MPEPTLAWGEDWLWLSGSLLLAILWAKASWFFRRPRPGSIGSFITHLVAWRFSPWLLQTLRLLYYIGVPFAALLWGHDAVIGRLLGLQRFYWPASGKVDAQAAVGANWIDWMHDVGWTAALGIGAWALLAVGWWAYRRALPTTTVNPLGPSTKISGWVLLRQAAYHEAHWAFYRNAPILNSGLYWGVWSGLVLVALEAALNPAWRRNLRDPQQAPAQLLRGALAVVSGALFLLTQNLWLAFALHCGVSWGLTAFARALPLRAHEAQRTPA